jgi:hypothetical protein
VTLAKKYWQGYIKDYEGASPMECVVHPGVCYIDIPNTIRRQKEVRTHRFPSTHAVWRLTRVVCACAVCVCVRADSA